MKFRSIIFIFLLLSSAFGSSFNVNKLTTDEIKTLKKIKAQGIKDGVSYSLMAIAIKESSLGRFLINVDSKDFGIYQANIKSVIARYKVKDTPWNRNKIAMKLVSDFEFATKNAIDELNFWRKVHGGNWRRVWGSYNGGWKYNSKRARKYSNDIARIIKQLQELDV